MKWILFTGILLVLLFAGVQTVSAAVGTGTIGLEAVTENTYYFQISSNVEGAKVYFSDVNGVEYYEGIITNGQLRVMVVGNSMKSYRVTADGYKDYKGQITSYPPNGGVITLYATLSPLSPTPTPSLIGGTTGYYLVHSNVDLGKVYFTDVNGEESFEGTLNQGVLRVMVYITATPFRSYRVEASGYQTYSGPINTVPSPGATVDLWATLVPIQPTVTVTSIGGNTGYFEVDSNIDGASVYFSDVNGKETLQGTIANGNLIVKVYLTATPFTSYRVALDGYIPYTGKISTYPTTGGTVILTSNLIPIIPTGTPIGGSQGSFLIKSNVNGATVYFTDVNGDETEQGIIANGQLIVTVYLTATPYTSYRVSAPGYTTVTGKIAKYPTPGGTVTITANLKAVTPTKTSVGGDYGYYSVLCNVNSAKVYFDDKLMGTIKDNSLLVKVYTTATPYSTYRIEASGYQPASGDIPGTPGKGEVIYIDAILQKNNPIGGSVGYYIIKTNVPGASVYFDNKLMGTTTNYGLVEQVYLTGTPYKTLKVTKTGYKTYTQPFADIGIPDPDSFIEVQVDLQK